MDVKTDNKELITDQHGSKYYEQQPANTREATLDDFYNRDGKLILDKPYLIKSMIHKNRYWANRVKERFPYPGSDFTVFLEGGFVFVFEGDWG